MDLSVKIAHFDQLGKILKAVSGDQNWSDYNIGITENEWNQLKESISFAKIKNGWFEEHFVKNALNDWGELLQKSKIKKWLSEYDSPKNINKNVAIIAAGNIPMVSFHDILSTLITGNVAHVKLSSDDDVLIPSVMKVLFQMDEGFKEQVHFYDETERMKNFDAVIATGNNNSARYFEHYFGKYPNIIRKNRTSVALITGEETQDELHLLGADLFTYFGLGCRNVSHILMPDQYDIDQIFGAIVDYNEIIHNKKYGNNYDYHKAIFLMNNDDLLENGFVMFRQTKELFAPLSTINYQRYKTKEEALSFIEQNKDDIQAVVGKDHIPFGTAQQPTLNDYADGVDTIEFLLDLH